MRNEDVDLDDVLGGVVELPGGGARVFGADLDFCKFLESELAKLN